MPHLKATKHKTFLNLRFTKYFISSIEVSHERRDTKIVVLGLTTTSSLGAEVSKLRDTTDKNETEDGHYSEVKVKGIE